MRFIGIKNSVYLDVRLKWYYFAYRLDIENLCLQGVSDAGLQGVSDAGL